MLWLLVFLKLFEDQVVFDSVEGQFRSLNWLYKWKQLKSVSANVTVTKNKSNPNMFEIEFMQNVGLLNLFLIELNPCSFLTLSGKTK